MARLHARLALALALSMTVGVARAQDDFTVRLGMGVVFYDQTKDRCFYEPVVGEIMAKIEELLAGPEWANLKRGLETDGGNVLTNLAGQMAEEPLSECSLKGTFIGQALQIASVLTLPDPRVESAAHRLTVIGGREVAEPASAAEIAGTPARQSATDTMREWNARMAAAAAAGDGAAQTDAPQPQYCEITIADHEPVAGPCTVEGEDPIIARLLPGGSGVGLFFYLLPEGNTADAYWNGEPGVERAHEPLGILKKDGDCWTSGLARICWRPDADKSTPVATPLANVRAYFEASGGPALLQAQALLLAASAYDGDVDGKWGPRTEQAFAHVLETYIAIGGNGPDWGINAPADTTRLLDWLAQAAYTQTSDGEFPD